MSVIRAFIAINMSAEIQRRLDAISRDLQRALGGIPIRWVPVENIHLTLKFLGDVSVSNLDMLKKILQVEAAAHPCFEISAGELGAFPSIRRPRVIWISIKAPVELAALQHSIETQTARLGYTAEDRPFSPHLTLGRIARNASTEDLRKIGEVLLVNKVGYAGAARVTAVHLYRSDLLPSGAVYSSVFTANLSEPSGSR